MKTWAVVIILGYSYWLPVLGSYLFLTWKTEVKVTPQMPPIPTVSSRAAIQVCKRFVFSRRVC